MLMQRLGWTYGELKRRRSIVVMRSSEATLADATRAATNWAIRAGGQDSYHVGDIRIGSTTVMPLSNEVV